MSNGGGIIIICFGVGEVECKNTIAIPHYENGIVTAAVGFSVGTSHAAMEKVRAKIEKKAREIQRIIAKATGGAPYEFDGDVNALPECAPHP